MSRRRVTFILAGVVILLAVIARVVLAAIGGGNGDGDAVDKTSSTPTLLPVQVQPTAVPVAARPLLVLNPLGSPPGGSITVWGSGFPGGATVDLYLKQAVSDNVNPVGVVEADQNGQFGGVSVTIPESVPSGNLIIQAKEYDGSVTAMATATVTDDEPQPVVLPTASTRVPPTAAATESPTATPKVAVKSQPIVTSQPTEQSLSTPQPQPTPSPKPTDKPQLTSQSQPTPSAKPTDKPQPPPQPVPTPPPNPTEPPQPPSKPSPEPDTPDASPPPSSVTVKPGDSLSSIAEHVYGDAAEWKSLYDANREAIGDNPNLIHPGTELDVPPKD